MCSSDLNPTQAVEAELADSSGIAPRASVGLMARRVGGLHNLGFIPKDLIIICIQDEQKR